MIRFLLAVAAFALVAPVGPPWAKFDDACAAASSTSKLVAVYTTIGSDPEGGDHGSPDADAALASKAVSARYGEFFWVRAADKATAKRVDAPSGGAHLIFVDPDGTQVGLWNVQVGGEAVVLKALDEAKALYEPKPVPWFDGEPDEKSDEVKKKLIVYAFLDDKENSEKAVKALEHPWVARDHGRLIFVRKYVLDSPLAKRFKVTSVPTFIFFDPTQKEGKEVVERKSGEITTRMIRAPMKKFFERKKKAALESK
jgi:hypothetical protein